MAGRAGAGSEGSAFDAEIRRYADSVLKRDATKTDYIVTPLVAGVLVACVLAVEAEQVADGAFRELWPGYRDAAREVFALCDDANDDRWNDDASRYGALTDFVYNAWPALLLWAPEGYVLSTIGVPGQKPPSALLHAVERWLRESGDRSLVECTFIAAYGCMLFDARRDELPLFSRSARVLRVELARRLREAGLISWPRIVRAAVADWNVGTLQRLAFEFAQSSASILETFLSEAVKLVDYQFDGDVDDDDAMAAPSPMADAAPTSDSSASLEKMASQAERIRVLGDENSRLVEKVERLEKEHIVLADRHQAAESYAASLKRELREETEQNKGLEWQLVVLKRDFDRLQEDIAVKDALAPDAPAPPPDSLEGRRVLLFTGQASAATRESMRQAFHEFGAGQVDCYWTDKTRGPESYPRDAIVVIDVTFMSHTDSGTVEDRARRSGTWCMLCRRGAALIGREAAARFRVQRAEKA